MSLPKVLEDGSIELDGKIDKFHFSGRHGYQGKYPISKSSETFREYRERVGEFVKKGFDIGDLSNRDYEFYCKGSGSYEGVDANDLIH